MPDTLDVPTPHGPARALLALVPDPVGVVFLGHGAGGGVQAPDLAAAAVAARAAGWSVVRVEQPYRVAGRRSPAPARQLDEAWTTVVERVRAEVDAANAPLVVGGRSSGARVACRTAAATGAAGVVCLAFPLRPPGRPDAPTRLPELDCVRVPVLVVQGEQDPFGIPPARRRRRVVRVAGDHGLKRDVPAVAAAVERWLRRLPAAAPPSPRPHR